MKDCEQYFMDRIVRDRPILIPGQGDQVCFVLFEFKFQT